jgi:hypothetical protein
MRGDPFALDGVMSATSSGAYSKVKRGQRLGATALQAADHLNPN